MEEKQHPIEDSKSQKKNKNKGQKKNKEKEFNRLDSKFQWKPHLDEDHIFPEEQEMIKEIRNDAEFKDLVSKWSDKRVLYFIIARRHDMNETKELLKKHFDKARQLGFLDTEPTFEHIKERFSNLKTNIMLKGAVDKHGQLIIYYRIRNDLPKIATFEEKYKFMYWESYYRCDIEPLRYLRNGTVIIVDMQDFGWKNIDMSSEAKAFNSDLTGLFPKRIRGMYVVNGGTILRLALGAAKFVLSKKIMKRISIYDKKEIKEMVPAEWLLKEYGGSLDMSFQDCVDEIEREDLIRIKANKINM